MDSVHRALCSLPCRTTNAKTGPPLGNIEVHATDAVDVRFVLSSQVLRQQPSRGLGEEHMFPTWGMIVLIALRHICEDTSDRYA